MSKNFYSKEDLKKKLSEKYPDRVFSEGEINLIYRKQHNGMLKSVQDAVEVTAKMDEDDLEAILQSLD